MKKWDEAKTKQSQSRLSAGALPGLAFDPGSILVVIGWLRSSSIALLSLLLIRNVTTATSHQMLANLPSHPLPEASERATLTAGGPASALQALAERLSRYTCPVCSEG